MILNTRDLCTRTALRKYLQKSRYYVNRFDELVEAMSPLGNLVFLLTINEVRRQGLTYLAFYALQRAVEEPSYSQYWLRQETGFEDYEISRACGLLAKSDLIEMKKGQRDRRVRLITPTKRGRQVLAKVLSQASSRLEKGIPTPGRIRRVAGVTRSLRDANRLLLGPLQLSFFDRDLFDEDSTESARARKKAGKVTAKSSMKKAARKA